MKVRELRVIVPVGAGRCELKCSRVRSCFDSYRIHVEDNLRRRGKFWLKDDRRYQLTAWLGKQFGFPVKKHVFLDIMFLHQPEAESTITAILVFKTARVAAGVNQHLNDF